MPKLSVIVPVFNVEKYLNRCLDSLCNQSLSDIEIICVDDCSSDSSAKILQKYSKIYKNLTVVNLAKNQGVSAARNAGLALAQGEYIAFVDSDDEVDLDFYEKLYQAAKTQDFDIVRGQAVEITYDGKKNFVKQIADGNKFFFLNYWLIAIYKKSLLAENKITFSTKHSLGEDLLFLNQALIATQSLKLIDGTFYYYHRREDSSDSKTLSESKIKSALDVYQLIIDNINLNISASDRTYNFLFHHFIMSCFYLSLKSENDEMKKICAQKISEIFVKCRDQNGLEIYFAKTAPHLFSLLKNQDIAGVENILAKCRSVIDIVTLGLRARIKNK